jgi:hypothetical protein
VGGTSMKDVGGAVLAGSSPPFLGRERAAVDVDVGPERRSPRYHETCLALDSFLLFFQEAKGFAKLLAHLFSRRDGGHACCSATVTLFVL